MWTVRNTHPWNFIISLLFFTLLLLCILPQIQTFYVCMFMHIPWSLLFALKLSFQEIKWFFKLYCSCIFSALNFSLCRTKFPSGITIHNVISFHYSVAPVYSWRIWSMFISPKKSLISLHFCSVEDSRLESMFVSPWQMFLHR